MTTKELAAALAKELKISQRRAEILVEAFFEEIKEALLRGEGVCFKNFGSFYVKEVKRPSRTGELRPKRRVRFRPSRKLLTRLRKETNR